MGNMYVEGTTLEKWPEKTRLPKICQILSTGIMSELMEKYPVTRPKTTYVVSFFLVASFNKKLSHSTGYVHVVS